MSTNEPKLSFRPLRRLSTLSLAVAFAMLASGAQAETLATEIIADSTIAGEVSFVLGKAYLEAAGQPKRLIRVGTPIRVKDRILTESNGHVHIHFVDQGLVSIRPHSSLEIVRYDYNPERPEDSSIKLNLLEGVTRSISGDGARSARERFRLNTPIAAIGVRGTDFVVSASDTGVRALVNEGVIVVAPFSSECLAATFGPCAVNAVELTQNSLQVIELDTNTPLPRLTPAPYDRESLAPQPVAVAENVTASEDKTASTEVYLESVTSIKVTTQATTLSAQNNVPKPPPVVPAPQPTPPEPVPPITPQEPDFTPLAAVDPAVLNQSQLVWGRWSSGLGQGAQERITLAYEEARATREITISNADYGLFRTENGSKRIASNLGVVSFGLDSAQAFFHSESGALAMRVGSGQLSIDFDEERFSTWLGLSSNVTGAIEFAASGRLYSGGYFHENLDTQRMAGAVSLDGTEAGYHFEKQIEGGTVKGITLWDRQ